MRDPQHGRVRARGPHSFHHHLEHPAVDLVELAERLPCCLDGRRRDPDRVDGVQRLLLNGTVPTMRLEFDGLEGLPVEQFMPTFMRLGLKPGVPLPAPPPGDPPPWMAKRPAGIAAIQRAFKRGHIDRDALRRFDRPVYFALGALSNPDQYGEIAKRLSGVFPDFELEVFEERHHFDPPHRIEPERLANSLKTLWRRAERSQPSNL